MKPPTAHRHGPPPTPCPFMFIPIRTRAAVTCTALVSQHTDTVASSNAVSVQSAPVVCPHTVESGLESLPRSAPPTAPLRQDTRHLIFGRREVQAQAYTPGG